jgi:acetyltransferase-like isoleucine patch superfamily enzyme
MNRLALLKDEKDLESLYKNLVRLNDVLGQSFMKDLNRLTSFNDLLFDRWDKAKKLKFGKGTNVYDNVLVIGQVKVGKECWIGPEVILDGSGDLSIGNFCTISAGVHIYTHDNVKQTLTSKKKPIERKEVKIGSNVYVGPKSIIVKGLTIGNNSVIGAMSFVNKDVPPNSIVVGSPAKIIGKVVKKNGEVSFQYF